MKRAFKIAAAAVVGTGLTLFGLAYGIHRYRVWDRTRDVLPTFSEIPAGPRAPSSAFLGLTIGRSSLADVQAWLAAHHIECRDTSMRALMQAGREEAQARMREAEARGDDPDGVTGASRANYHSKKEQNPQVYLSCENIALTNLDGVSRAGSQGSTGTVLLIFDSKDHPLRYALVERKYMLQLDVLAEFKAATERFSKALGPPTAQSAIRPLEDEDPNTRIFDRYRPVSNTWAFADRKAEVVVMNFGLPKGISVRESFEVPWPVRTDNPGAGAHR